MKIERIYTRSVVGAARTDTLEQAAAAMRRLLVTAEGGAAAGIVSIDDIVDGLSVELASAAALMKADVARERANLVPA